ncbi:M56 family metallopeptidase [Streptomyces sp. NPDC001595]|uniref:M56 family metallopeptidase n=1 Tax=Streptomyces sp. NPDC001532 TaxID=3154520 RepID=UPI00332A0BAF
MNHLLVLIVLALAVPWAAAALARRLAGLLPPRAACWALTGAAVVLAGGTFAALFGLFHVPLLASLWHVPLRRVVAAWPAAVPVACAAGLVLALQCGVAVRRWLRHRSVLARAWESAGAGAGHGDLLVVPGDGVEAFALPGFRGRRGTVVVTSGMVRALGAEERAVLLAHERAHLAGRHHVLSAVVDLASVAHPALRSLRESLGFHLERWADESAAAAVGDRRLAAAAVARAALAQSDRGHGGARGYPLLSVTSGPVPQRVKALLAPAPAGPRGPVRKAGAAALALAVVLCVVAAPAVTLGLHEFVEHSAAAVRRG